MNEKKGGEEIAYLLRPFEIADSEAVLRIAADTAFFGEAVEAFFEDRNLFLDMTYRYYTTLEARTSWVAVVEGEVVGFLVGCLDTSMQYRRWVSYILPMILRKFLLGKYRFGALSRRYLWGVIKAQGAGKTRKVDLRQYPAHLHINLDRRWRGFGIGRHLLEAYLWQLYQEGVKGVHLRTTDHNKAACRLYEKMGFKILDAHPTDLWRHLISQPIEQRCYGLLLH